MNANVKPVVRVPRLVLGILALCGASQFYETPVRADDVYTFVVKKQVEKEKYRWSLADWLETRDKMRLQDLWLAAHTSLYEYFIGGNYQVNQDGNGAYFRNYELFIGAYSSLVGLEVHYEQANVARVHGILDFRFFGRHDQGTNLTAQFGGVNVMPAGETTYRSFFLGLSLTFYIARSFGLEGVYRHYFPSSPNEAGLSFSGDRLLGGAFIDFKFVRVYADYFSDSGSGNPYSGLTLGTKIYF